MRMNLWTDRFFCYEYILIQFFWIFRLTNGRNLLGEDFDNEVRAYSNLKNRVVQVQTRLTEPKTDLAQKSEPKTGVGIMYA